MTTPASIWRPRRSCLYLPASNPRAIEKAKGLPCDVVILDLEDAVAPDAKAAARAAAVEAIRAGGFGRRELVLRVNGLDTPWGDADLKAAAEAGPDAVLVPKIGDAGDIARYDGRLSHAPGKTRLWAMIETARSLFHLEGIGAAAKTARLSALCLGPNDLSKETGWRMTPGREPFFAAFSLTVAAARAHGIAALDGPFGGIENAEGLALECRQGRDFGFDGKTLIHPSQIDTANAAFSPDEAEIAHARAVIEAFAQPENAGKGAIRVNGRMAERLHLAEAEKVVALAEAIS
jgi:citrate lyase subunit beta/citryl-CoA lyase